MDFDEPNDVSASFGAWMNKRSILAMAVPFAHKLTPTPGGWRLTALDDGDLVVRFTGGESEELAFQGGDYILASGDDLYISLQRAPLIPDRGPEPQDAEESEETSRPRTVAERRHERAGDQGETES